MSPTTGSGVPYFPGVGNHDRKAPPGVPPGTGRPAHPGVQGDLANYKQVFADRPVSLRRRRAVQGRRLHAADAPGRRSRRRLLALLRGLGTPSAGSSSTTRAGASPTATPARTRRSPTRRATAASWITCERTAGDASRAGMTVFAVMHMPTRDPRDQSYIDPTTFNHVMGKGLNPSQAPRTTMRFEEVARAGRRRRRVRRPHQGPVPLPRAAAGCRTTSTAAPAASCTPTARWAPTTATGTASG